MPETNNRTSSEPLATPLSRPCFTSTGPAREARPSRMTSTRPISKGLRNSLSSRLRLNRRSCLDSFSTSTTGKSRTGGSASTRASNSGVGARFNRQPPPPPPRPGPILGGPMVRTGVWVRMSPPFPLPPFPLPPLPLSPVGMGAHAEAVTPSRPAPDDMAASASMLSPTLSARLSSSPDKSAR